MIKFLIRKFVKNSETIENKAVREKIISLSGMIGIFCNALIFLIKLQLGFTINSIALISDAFNNLFDIASSLISILTAKLANRPADTEHPHGHGRFEYIGSLVVAFIIFAVGFELFKQSYARVVNPEPVDFNLWVLLLMSFTVMIKLWMFLYNRYLHAYLNSSINKATAFDSLSDVVATSLLILSMLIALITPLPIDGLMGIIIALMIMYSGFDVAKEMVGVLLGSNPEPEVIQKIETILNEGPNILEIHDLHVHDYGPGRILGSVHVELSDTLNIVEAHRIIDALEKQIESELNIVMTIHVDPISTDQTKTVRVQNDIQTLVSEIDKTLKIEHFRIAQAKSIFVVIFDIILEKEMIETDQHTLKQMIKHSIRDRYPHYDVVIDTVISHEKA